MYKEIIQTDKAPKAIGPYSQGVKFNGMVFLSGQIAIDRQTFEIVSDDVKIQTEIIMQNISALLDASGSSLDNIIKTTIFLKDLNNFSIVNEVYGSFFRSERPARSCVEVSALPKNALVEIEVVAHEKI